MSSGTASSAPDVPHTHPQKLKLIRMSSGLIVSRCPTTNGVIALDAGSWDSVLRIMPSVVISEALIDDAAGVIEEALAGLS